jgi:hypothetical protein
METSGGYPEEQPERTPSDDPREKDSPGRDETPAETGDQPDNDDGTATGNPHSGE